MLIIKFQKLTSTIAIKLEIYISIWNIYTCKFKSPTLITIPERQIRLKFKSLLNQEYSGRSLERVFRNVQISFQKKLFTIATSAATTLLRVKFHPNIHGEPRRNKIPISTITPLPPTRQKRIYFEKMRNILPD